MAERSDDVDGHPRIPFTDHCDHNLEHTGQWSKNEGENGSSSCLLERDIENPVGVVKIPVMLVGPLLLRGECMNGCVVCPFATAKKVLVESATRGTMALTQSGGVRVRSTTQCLVCGPAFQMRSMIEVEWLWGWLKANFPAVHQQVKLFNQHVELVELVPFHFDQTLVVYFRYHTQEALSQNIVTNGTMHCCHWVLRRVEQELPNVRVINFQIESNVGGDTTTAAANLFQTRGIHVMAKAWIPDEVLRLVFQVDSTTLMQYYELSMSESEAIGVSIHMGDLLAAVFIATGQDVASIGKSSSTHLLMAPASTEEIDSREMLEQLSGSTTRDNSGGEVEPGGVCVSLALQNLILDRQTGLATQKECLSRMGCYGKESVRRLAEIIAGFALGLALSRLAANVRGQSAFTHEMLGRSQPVYGLQDKDLNDDFFSMVLGSRGRLVEWSTWDLKTGTGILSKLKKQSKRIGHLGFSISYTRSIDGSHGQLLKVVLKSKPTDIETGNMISDMAQGCRLTLAKIYQMYRMDTGFRYCHIREVELARLDNPILTSFMPTIYHTVNEPAKDVYVVVMEYLTGEHYSLLNTVEDISVWTPSDLKVVLRDLAMIHSQYLGKTEWLSSQPWLETKAGRKMVAMAALRQAMVDHARSEFPEMWTEVRSRVVYEAISILPQMWQALDSSPKTMTHNDCSPRNICLRRPPITVAPDKEMLPSVAVQATPRSYSSCATPLITPTTDSPITVQFTPYDDPRTLCIYDWELATVDVPQHDLAEFLAFTLEPTTPLKTRLELMEFYLQHLQYYSGMEYPWERFLSVFNLSCLDIAMHRLMMYTLVHKDCHCHFLPRVVRSHFRYIFDQIAAGSFTSLITSKL